MIHELTIKNLLNLGLTKEDAEKLFNAEEYTLQCNAGNFHTIKAENKIYTGIDFWRLSYLTKNLSFPFNAPELVNDYFSLSLEVYLNSKKEILKTLYDETFETQNFINNEIDWANETILFWKNKGLRTKKKLIDVLNGYLNFLENYKIPSGNNKAQKIVELKDFFKNTTPLQLENIKSTFSKYDGKNLSIVIYFLIQKDRLNIIKDNTDFGLSSFTRLFANLDKGKTEAVRKCFESSSTHTFDLILKNNLKETGIESKIDAIYKVG